MDATGSNVAVLCRVTPNNIGQKQQNPNYRIYRNTISVKFQSSFFQVLLNSLVSFLYVSSAWSYIQGFDEPQQCPEKKSTKWCHKIDKKTCMHIHYIYLYVCMRLYNIIMCIYIYNLYIFIYIYIINIIL